MLATTYTKNNNSECKVEFGPWVFTFDTNANLIYSNIKVLPFSAAHHVTNPKILKMYNQARKVARRTLNKPKTGTYI